MRIALALLAAVVALAAYAHNPSTIPLTDAGLSGLQDMGSYYLVDKPLIQDCDPLEAECISEQVCGEDWDRWKTASASSGRVATFCNNDGPIGEPVWQTLSDDGERSQVIGAPTPFCFRASGAWSEFGFMPRFDVGGGLLAFGSRATLNANWRNTTYTTPWRGSWAIVGVSYMATQAIDWAGGTVSVQPFMTLSGANVNSPLNITPALAIPSTMVDTNAEIGVTYVHNISPGLATSEWHGMAITLASATVAPTNIYLDVCLLVESRNGTFVLP